MTAPQVPHVWTDFSRPPKTPPWDEPKLPPQRTDRPGAIDGICRGILDLRLVRPKIDLNIIRHLEIEHADTSLLIVVLAYGRIGLGSENRRSQNDQKKNRFMYVNSAYL